MNDYFWHEDGVFMALVEKPLIVIGIAFAVMLAVTIALAVISKGGSDDA